MLTGFKLCGLYYIYIYIYKIEFDHFKIFIYYQNSSDYPLHYSVPDSFLLKSDQAEGKMVPTSPQTKNTHTAQPVEVAGEGKPQGQAIGRSF